MPMSRREARGAKAFAFPVFGIAVLLATYWIIAAWQDVPSLISSTIAAVRWPT